MATWCKNKKSPERKNQKAMVHLIAMNNKKKNWMMIALIAFARLFTFARLFMLPLIVAFA